MGWTGPPSQANQAVGNYGIPNGYSADLSPYYSNAFQPQPGATNTNLEYGGHPGVNGFHRIICQESPQTFQYPCVPPPQTDMTMGMLPSQQTTYMYNNEYQMSATTSSNRIQRNMAEKLRRDKLNAFINDLAALVPLVSNSSKRMDKTSVLRLSATFLRQQKLESDTRDQLQKFPESLRRFNWSELLLEDMNGVLLIVTSAGKIVFILDNIEKILGHTQSELLGQSLYKITCPEDHEELKRCLTPDDADESSADADLECDDLGSESGSSTICSRLYTSRVNSESRGTRSSSQQPRNSSNPDVEKQRRSCYLRLRTRSLARTEQPQYELVHLMGFLKVPKKLASQVHKKSRKHKVDVSSTNSNEITLVAILKPFKERRVTETSLLEATRDEYITRHSLDGRIIYSDHRISVVSGYLFEEVSGLQAFNFMHKDDVRLVMIALRQMFWRGESFGSSCYRLKSRTGDFIYLKTHGYLELNANAESYASYICVNTLVSNEEGEKEIMQMRRRFSALIESKLVDPGTVAIAKDNCRDPMDLPGIEDPFEMQDAIKAMISNIPTPTAIHEDPEKSLDTQFVKAKLMSKALPPVSQTSSSNLITTVLEDKSPKSVVMSPQSSTMATASSVSQPPTPTALTPSSPSVSSSCAMQNRPSVLRLASRQPITIYDGIDNNVVSDCDVETSMSARQQLDTFGNRSTTRLSASEADRFDQALPIKHERVGVVVLQKGGGVKRQFEFDDDPSKSSLVPTKKLVSTPSITTLPGSERLACHVSSNHSYSFISKCSRQVEVKTSMSPLPTNEFTELDCLEDCETNFRFDDVDSFEQKPTSVQMLDLLRHTNEDDLEHNHIKLESRMQLQEAQMNNIEGKLAEVPHTHPERFCLENNLGKLREEHTKHAELLKTLREDRASLQPN